MPVAEDIRSAVETTPERTFMATRDFSGSSRAVESALSKLAAHGDLMRVRHGLYWKGPRAAHGMLRPRSLELALQVAGPGSGPAGVSAARHLGLTTQIPAVERVAVPGRAPKPVRGVRFSARPYSRERLGLTPTEVALVELLREWPSYSESPWADLVATIKQRTAEGDLRPQVLAAEVSEERSPRLRDMWRRLQLALAA